MSYFKGLLCTLSPTHATNARPCARAPYCIYIRMSITKGVAGKGDKKLLHPDSLCSSGNYCKAEEEKSSYLEDFKTASAD